jgi:sugar phosphate isomerase/epimerase
MIVVHLGEVVTNDNLEHKLRALFDAGKKGEQEYREVFELMVTERSSKIEPHLAAVEKSLMELLAYSSNTGRKLSLENRYHFMDIPSPNEMSRFLSIADDSRLGMQFDIGHAITLDALGFYPWMEWLERFGHRIFGLHLHDVQGVTDHFAPGLGDIDYSKVAMFVPPSALRTLEVRGDNTMEQIKSGLEILSTANIVYRLD